MAEPPCRLCGSILSKKRRRVIFSESFGVFNQLVEIIDEVPKEQDDRGKYVCSHCWNKLKRLSKLEHDIWTKLEALREERCSLIGKLRETHRQACLLPQSTSRPSLVLTPKSKKHPLVHSPTPRKLKKPLLKTPHKERDLPTNLPDIAEKRKTKIQLFSPDKIKVFFLSFFGLFSYYIY